MELLRQSKVSSNRECSSAVPVDDAGRRPPLTAISIVADTVWLNTCVASFTFIFVKPLGCKCCVVSLGQHLM